MNKDNDKILLFESPLKEVIWGGNYFKNVLHLTEEDKKFGEYWSLSGYDSYSSIIKNGKYQGESLAKLYKEHGELFPSSHTKDFPILIKLIATSDDLSVQVHPDDKYAAKFNEFGKTESWLILNSDNGRICYGHNETNKEELDRKVTSNDFSFLDYHNVSEGNFVKVNAGTVHALGKGLVLLEVQQSSNLTYRLFDYNRRDKDGNLRELHIDKSLDVIKVPDKQVFDTTNYLRYRDDVTLWDNGYFNIKLIEMRRQMCLNTNHEKYMMFTVAKGKVKYDGHSLGVGESFIATSNCIDEMIYGRALLLVTESYK